MKEIEKKKTEEVKKILTAEQQTKYEKFLQENRGRFGGRNRGEGRPPREGEAPGRADARVRTEVSGELLAEVLQINELVVLVGLRSQVGEEHLVVIDITASAPPCLDEPCPFYSPKSPCRNVLEVKGGLSASHGLRPGDVLVLEPALDELGLLLQLDAVDAVLG